MLFEPVQSIIDFSFYPKAARRSIGRAIGYLLYLGFIFSIASVIALYIRLTPILDNAVKWAVTSIPPLTFANGKASSALKTSQAIRLPMEPAASLIIDTTRATPVTPEEMAQQHTKVYLTQNTLYVMMNETRFEQYDLSKNANPKPVTIDADFFRMLRIMLPKIFFPIAWLCAWAIFFIWKIMATLFYSLAALIINAISSAELDYESLFKICIYAQTPVIGLQCVLLYLPQRIPGFFVLAFLTVALYIWQAIRHFQPAEDPS